MPEYFLRVNLPDNAVSFGYRMWSRDAFYSKTRQSSEIWREANGDLDPKIHLEPAYPKGWAPRCNIPGEDGCKNANEYLPQCSMCPCFKAVKQ
jgi:hypothetical protein